MTSIQAKGAATVPAVNPFRCIGCSHCVVLCQKLGPNVLDIINNSARVVRPMNCITDGMCMLACPTKAIVLDGPEDGNCPAHAA